MSNLTSNAHPLSWNSNTCPNHSSKNRIFPLHCYPYLAQCLTKIVHGSKHRAMQINTLHVSSIVLIGISYLSIKSFILKISVTQEEESTNSSDYSPMISALHKLVDIQPFLDLFEVFSVIQHPSGLGIHTVKHVVYK